MSHILHASPKMVNGTNGTNVLSLKMHGLSKFTHVAMILEDPSKKLVEEIENMISRFIQAENYRTTKELIFTPKQHGGLGIPRLKEFWSALRVGWLKRTFSSQSFWLKLLQETSKRKTPPTYWSEAQMKAAFAGGQNPFWKQTLKTWKKILKNTAEGIQDRTTGTASKILQSSLDTEQGGEGFPTTNPHLTVEVIFRTYTADNGRFTAAFREWDDLSKVFEKEKHFNYVVYKGLRETYKFLLPMIEAESYIIYETLPPLLTGHTLYLKQGKRDAET